MRRLSTLLLSLAFCSFALAASANYCQAVNTFKSSLEKYDYSTPNPGQDLHIQTQLIQHDSDNFAYKMCLANKDTQAACSNFAESFNGESQGLSHIIGADYNEAGHTRSQLEGGIATGDKVQILYFLQQYQNTHHCLALH